MRYAAKISNAYGLALLLTLLTFLVTSMLPHDDWARIVAVSLVGLTAMVGLASSGIRHPRLHFALIVSLLAVGAATLSALFDAPGLMSAAFCVDALLLLVTGATILSRVLLAPTVTFRTILGALTTYTMLGILYGFAYLVVAQLQDKPFFVGTTNASDGKFLFFSYTTLTTTGYGNLVPASQPGESIAVLEMLTGQIFLVTLVAGLVSLWRPGRRINAKSEADG
jgi:hypothetical protein